ncbi:MAG: hypothetical protein JNN00_18480 [Chitinophagaceae bacterium]|nr:hypothetical protein [Chitinophagaceae bacterium]
MQTMKNSSHPRPVLSQSQNNTTLWIGHLKTDPTDHFAGQTFTCPAEGQLDNIQLYSAAVQYGGEVVLSLHEFDPETKKWGPAIGSSTVKVHKGDHAKWMRFGLPPVQLRQGVTYGFRLMTHEALVGLGEAASGNKHPFTFGHEWNGDSLNQTGHYYSYFSLAFKVELCA